MTARYGLRTDERQWLIYDEETLGAVMRGLEALALHIAGGPLSRHPLQPVRAIGHFMRRVGEARFAEMHKNDGAQRVVASHLQTIFTWLGRQQRGLATPPPTEALDEIYAAVFRLDSRAQSAGVVGSGVHRSAVRGD